MKKKKNLIEQEQAYWQHREDARQLVVSRLSEITDVPVRLTDINVEALQQAIHWRLTYLKERIAHMPRWDWAKQLARFRRRPRRLELAIWNGKQVCGLALGRISDRRVVASIHLLEGNPEVHPLSGKVAVIASRYLLAFAALLGCREISIELPIPELVEFYQELGFKNVTKRGKKVLRLKQVL